MVTEVDVDVEEEDFEVVDEVEDEVSRRYQSRKDHGRMKRDCAPGCWVLVEAARLHSICYFRRLWI